MKVKEELDGINGALGVLKRKMEHLLRDRVLQRELEFHNGLNELLDSFDCPFELVLEVVVLREDVPTDIRRRVAEIVNMDFEITKQPIVEEGNPVPKDRHDVRLASQNALAWQERFGHKSFEEWFR